jgi:O-antigen ligase/tetratricopeptide (TPR) repeat protein
VKYRPKFSWIAASFVGLLGIMAIADALGPDPRMSFWSNFERMEGYVTLVHTFMYFIVAGSVLTTDKLWNRFFNTTLVSGVILALYAFAQLSGNITINQGGWRLDGTLGNSAYMAIYMLFHVFIAIWMFLRAESNGWRATYGALTLLFVFLLIQTATRGTILGMVGGLGVTTAYVALFSTQYPRVRKMSAGILLALVLIVGLFIKFKDSSFIQENPYLQRVASISLSEGGVRFKIWHMAYEGFKERPLLGWGQSNFNYIFNKNYDPSLYFAESWYDRVHNIVFDWLVAGGILGAAAYFGILLAALYYLIILPFREEKHAFTVVERGVLIGLLAGYTFHNLFVFDNIISYIFYGTILALIHTRVGREMKVFTMPKFDTRVIEQVWSPVVGVALVAVLYFVNVPGIQAAGDIIDAFSTKSPEAMLAQFEEALSRNSFADQEIREQMTRQAQTIFQTPDVSEDLKQKFFARVEEELLKQIEEKPGDARVHVFISSFYRMAKDTDKAAEQLRIARELSPQKQQIIFEQGLVELQREAYDDALSLFKEAYELDTAYDDAAVFYALSAVYAGKPEVVDEVIKTEGRKVAFAQNDMAVQAVYQKKQYDLLIEMFETRIKLDPQNTQFRVNLAFVLNESGDTGAAVQSLSKAAEDIPSFKTQSEQFIAQLLAGKVPSTTKSEVRVGNEKVKSVEVTKP